MTFNKKNYYYTFERRLYSTIINLIIHKPKRKYRTAGA